MEQVIDGAMRLLGFLFSATFGRANKTGQLGKAILIFAIVAVLSVLAFGVYLFRRGMGTGIEWEQITCLSLHHGQPTIVGLSSDAIHVRLTENTENGVRIWEGKPWPTFLGDPYCFVGVPTDTHNPIVDSCQPTFALPPPPGLVKERIGTMERDEYGRLVCLETVVLTDETVWYWRSVQEEASDLLVSALVFGGFPGSLLGFAVVWLIMLLHEHTSSRRGNI